MLSSVLPGHSQDVMIIHSRLKPWLLLIQIAFVQRAETLLSSYGPGWMEGSFKRVCSPNTIIS
jgi:hypothetical protein